jgi:hypothetical protein
MTDLDSPDSKAELFGVLIDLEQNYIDRLFFGPNEAIKQFLNDANSLTLSGDKLTDLSESLSGQQNINLVTPGKNLECINEVDGETDLGSFFNCTQALETQSLFKYILQLLTESLSLSQAECKIFLIKDGEYLAKLLMRGVKSSKDDKQEKLGRFFSKLRVDFPRLLKIGIEVPAQAKILITFLNRLAFGFISKHEPISIKCIQFFRVVFSEINVQCLKGSVDPTKSSSQFGSFLEI